MAGFGYVNQNNPVAIGEAESQEMINCRIDKGYLEYFEYPVDESVPVPNRVVTLPNGKQVKIRPSGNEWIDEGVVQWRNKVSTDEADWTQPEVYLEDSEKNYFTIEPINYSDRTQNELAASSFNPKAAGTYFYAVTLYDKRTFEESSPLLFSVDITQDNIDDDVAIRFTVRPILRIQQDYYQLRFYRMPFGGTEYLLTFIHEANYSQRWQKFDPTPDEYLGEMCNTENLTLIPFGNTDEDSDGSKDFFPNSIALFDDKLWIGGRAVNEQGIDYGLLYFSRTGSWTSFPATNFFSFPSPVVGITTYDQALVVQTEKTLYYIYGEPDEYVMKEIDYKFKGIAKNSGQALGRYTFLLALPDITEKDKALGVFLFNGSAVTEISQKICNELPVDISHKNWVSDNRFFIFEELSGRRVVYDTLGLGFCFVDLANHSGFYYRTKEFSVLPNGKQYIKKVCIRAKGSFIMYIVADGDKVITKVRLTSQKVKDHFCYVKPRRAVSFSFVFEGWEGTEIYDWRIVE